MEVSVDCERVAEWLAPMLQQAEQDHPIARTHRFAVRRLPEGYAVEEDGAPPRMEATPEAAGYAVFSRMHALALAALPEFTKIHAGSARWQGRRVIAVGPPHAGKTTLMTRLVYAGFAVEGDEMVLVRDGVALPYPRRFGVRAPTVDLIPQLGALTGGGRPAPLVVDPVLLGAPWRIEAGPVDAVLFLEPNHGGETALVPCPKHDMVRRVMSQSSAPEAGKRQWIRDVCAIVDRASSHVLRLGRLDAAVVAVTSALQGTSKAAPAAETRDG